MTRRTFKEWVSKSTLKESKCKCDCGKVPCVECGGDHHKDELKEDKKNKEDCGKGKYWCMTDKKCKKIPKGWHMMRSGLIMKDKEHEEEEEGKKNGNGNGEGSESNGGGVSESSCGSTSKKRRKKLSEMISTSMSGRKYKNIDNPEDQKRIRKEKDKKKQEKEESSKKRKAELADLRVTKGIRFYDKKGSGYIKDGKKNYDESVSLDEKCWKGYEKKGMKTMFGKRYPNCVKKEEYSDWRSELEEANKSGDNSLRDWFSKSRSSDGTPGWVQLGGKYAGKPCARQEGQTTKPKCGSSKMKRNLSKKEEERAFRRKNQEDPNPDRKGKAKNVATEEVKKDHEYEMARRQLATVNNASKRLKKKMGKKGEGELKAWVQSKLTRAADDIDTVADYMTNESEGFSEQRGGGWIKVGNKTANIGNPRMHHPDSSTYQEPTLPRPRPNVGSVPPPVTLRSNRSTSRRTQQTSTPRPTTQTSTTNSKPTTSSSSTSGYGNVGAVGNVGGNLRFIKDRSAARNAALADAQRRARGLSNSYEPEGELIGEGEKDACYKKVKSRYSVWPSAYASGALVKCRKVGAANWGNKTKKEGYEFSNWRDEFRATEYETVDIIETTPLKETEEIRYCPKCKKNEKKRECKYGEKYWKMFSLPPSLGGGGAYDPNEVHPANEGVSFEIGKGHRKASRTAKIRNLAKGTKNEGEKEAAMRKLPGPSLALKDSVIYPGELKTEDYQKLQKTGNVFSIMLMWRGKTYRLQLFFSGPKRPSREEVKAEIQKFYPGGVLTHYYPSPSDSSQPIVVIQR